MRCFEIIRTALVLAMMVASSQRGAAQSSSSPEIGIVLSPGMYEVNPLLFSSYSEVHGGDIVPGIYEQYIINPSFEEWYKDGKEVKSEVFFKNIQEYPGVAYPWEFLHVWGDARFELSDDCVNTSTSQKITLASGDEVRLFQKIALPYYRVHTYKLTFYAKADSKKAKLKVRLLDNKERNTSRSQTYKVPSLGPEWHKYEVVLKASKSLAMHIKRYHMYLLSFELSGEGAVFIDQVNLFPTDCVEGIFNPETLEYFKEYRVAGIRWPGGNYTSCYHWKNGIGDVDLRPSTPNRAWCGFDPNGLGTDEFMRFCELAGITPIMGVGFGEITKEEIADWVEYCNGDVSTPMGALRASNGHPEPYNVKNWGVGNEVYGDYQIGHTTPEIYSQGMIEIVKAMRSVDPDINIIASAYGVHNYYRRTSPWNEVVIPALSPYVDMVDAHDYVYGPRGSVVSKNSAEDNFRTYAAANCLLRDYVASFREMSKGTGLKLVSLEWGILPPGVKTAPVRTSFANLLLSAMQYNEMIRHADIYQMAAFHNFSFYVQPHYLHAEPVNARTVLYKEFSRMGSGRLMNSDVQNMPLYDVPLKYKEIPVKGGTPEVDYVAVEKGSSILVSLVNRSLESPMHLSISVGRVSDVTGRTYTSSRPFDSCTWPSNPDLRPEVSSTDAHGTGDGTISVTLPPMSFTMLEIAR